MLVACKECGAQVSSSAASCPKCGAPNPTGRGQLVIARAKQIRTALNNVKVVIRGEVVGDLRSGQALTLDLPPGEYPVEVRAEYILPNVFVNIFQNLFPNSTVATVLDGAATVYNVKFTIFLDLIKIERG